MFSKDRAMQFLRFCTVGLSNTTVDFAAFFILIWGGTPYLLAQVLAYSAGIVNSFFLNRKWTFRISGRINSGEAARFVVVNGFSLLASTAVLSILQDLGNGDLWLNKVIATVGGLAVNFIGSRLWVFAEKPLIDGVLGKSD